MRLPFVSRLAFDVTQARAMAAEARYDDLLDRYHALKVTGASTAKAAPPAPIPPIVDPEQRILEDAEAAFVAQAAEDFQRQGMSETQARQAAEKLRQQVAFTDPVPFGLN